jgi:cyclopropane fatty-acyl-phospholipid synthase-like methyltransferase
LTYAQKAEFFKAAYAHLNDGGILLLIDTFREEHQDLPSYLAAYCHWLRTDWQGIDPEEKEIACQHILENDFPETLADFAAFSQQAGFSAFQSVSRYQWHHVLRFQS